MDFLHICKSCRSCCQGTEIRVKDQDIERWKKENRLDILLAINPLIGASRQLIKKQNKDECIFLTEDGRCRIHDTKPYICKRFPVTKKQAEIFNCKLINYLELK